MTFGFGHGFTRGVGAAGGPILSLGFTGPNFPANVTFSRGTAATMMGQNRLIQYAPMNLVPRSQSGFGSNPGWLFNGPTAVSTNNTAPDSTATAIKIGLQSTAINSCVLVLPQPTLTVGATYTFSMYAKAAEYSLFNLGVQNTVAGCQFNLLTGTAGTPGSDAATTVSNPTITNVGNGWYRCSITVVRPTTAGTSLMFTPSNVAWASGNIDQIVTGAADGASGIYVWGGQLENGGTVGAYSVTTGTAYYGPRQDYDPTTLVAQNLFQQSDNLAPSWWGASNGSATANATVGPTGVPNAVLFTEDSSSLAHQIASAYALTINLTCTISVYAKANSAGRYLTITGGGISAAGEWPVWDLFAGTAAQTGATTIVKSVAISSAGNGWYRCSARIVPATPTAFVFALANSTVAGTTPSYAGNGTSGLYLWGAQLNEGATTLPYTATTSAAITQCAPLGLFVEEARTNLTIQSEALNAAAWTTNHATITTDAVVSPDGNQTADALVEDATAASSHELLQAWAKAASAITYTYTAYVKAAGRSWIGITLWDNVSNGYRFWFNVTTGVIGSSAALGTPFTAQSYSMSYVGNGWYRCVVTATSNTGTALTATHYSTDADLATAPATGLNAAGLYIWGAQLEAGAFATSYIPTAAAAVTRNADNASLAVGSWFNASAGTFLVQAIYTENSNTPGSLGMIGTTSNGFNLGGLAQRWFNGTTNIATANSITLGTNTKSGMSYTASSRNICLNGGTVVSDANIPFNLTPTGFYLGNPSGSSQYLNGWIKSLSYYNTALTNAQLQALTT
jgi:hypothetical protein